MATFRENMSDVRGVGSYVRKHWSGGFSLGFAYWVNGVLITVLLVLLNLGLENYLISIIPTLSRGQLQALVLAMLIVPFVITVWQLAGIWHSAFAHVGRGGKSGWAMAAKVSVVLGFIRTAIELVKVVPDLMPLFGV